MSTQTVNLSTVGRAGVARHRKSSRPRHRRAPIGPRRSWLELATTAFIVGTCLTLVTELGVIALTALRMR